MGFYRIDENGKKITKKVVLDCQKAVKNGEEIRVEQHHAKEVNINNIVKKHGADMIAKVAALQEFTFDDVTGNDFQENMNALIKAKDTFSQLPDKIRHKFKYNPAVFMDFVHNPDNKDKLVEMGLANPPPTPQQPVQVAVVSQPEPSGDSGGNTA
jgi:hypothetical protein